MAISAPAGTHSAEWHAERLDGIGGSEAPSLFGLSGYVSGAELSLRKIMQEIPDESNPTERDLRRRLGNMLEDTVATLYSEQMGRPVHRAYVDDRAIWHPTLPAFAHPDRIADRLKEAVARCPDDLRRVMVEIKTREFATGWGEPTGGWDADDSDRIPRDVLVQVQHDLFCLGFEVAHVVALFGLGKLRIYRIPASRQWFADFEAVYPEFWRIVDEGRAAVARGEEPVLWPVSGSEADLDFLARRHKGEAGRSILPNDEQAALLLDCARADVAAKAAAKAYDALKAQVQEFMGDAVACSSSMAAASWSAKGEPGTKLNFEKAYGLLRGVVDDLLASQGSITWYSGTHDAHAELDTSVLDEIEAGCTEEKAGSPRRFTVKLAKGIA